MKAETVLTGKGAWPAWERCIGITAWAEGLISVLFEHSRPVEFRFDALGEAPAVGDIFIGRVKDVKKELSAAFIEIRPGLSCFYPLSALPSAFFLKRAREAALTVGDELLVQVTRETFGEKHPSVTSELTLTGRFLVLTGKKELHFSKKLSAGQKEAISLILQANGPAAHGFIARTNAAGAKEEEIKTEMAALSLLYTSLREKAATRPPFTCLWMAPKEYERAVLDAPAAQTTGIITDNAAVYERLCGFLAEIPQGDSLSLCCYEDPLLPLSKRLQVKKELEEALYKRVWLKNGAYLVIEETEALTVIDVNSGKAEAHGKSQEASLLLHTNLLAAAEIARQLRLRNLSGIIVIDFINMKRKEDIRRVAEELDMYVRQDPVSTKVKDITGLQLVELTRKKIRRPLSQEAALRQGGSA